MYYKKILSLFCCSFLTLLFSSTVVLSAGFPHKGAVAQNAMVTTTEIETTKLVLGLLKDGWTAVDAAIATQFLMGVYEPGMTGLGGFGFEVTLYDAKSGEITELIAGGRAPAKSSPDMFEVVPGVEPGLPAMVKNRENVIGHKAPLVPPIVRGAYKLHQRYGTKTWAELLAPAIKVAEEGFSASETFISSLRAAEQILRSFPESLTTYFPDGKVPELGDKITNPDLARAIRLIAEKGPEVFYEGEIAQAIFEHLHKHGGIITKEDFMIPDLEEQKLTSFTYRGRRILVASSLGGSALAQMLNIISSFDMKGKGYLTPESLHTLIEAMKIAFTDRYAFAADINSVATPVDGMMSWMYGRDRSKEIHPNQALQYEPGNPWPYQSIPRQLVQKASADKLTLLTAMGVGDHETTQFDIVDQYGNMVVMITSLRSNFGSGLTVPGFGFVLNNGMALFDPRPNHSNSIDAFKRPLANGAQIIVLDEQNRPSLIMGAPGGRAIITATAQVLINMFDYEMSLQDAIDSPRLHTEAVGNLVLMEPRIPEPTREALKAKGHEIRLLPDFHTFAFARTQAIQINHEAGLLFGGSDPRTNGAAMGF